MKINWLSRVGEVRYLKVLYGSNKGKVKSGDVMFSTFQGGNDETAYSSDTIDEEPATGSGTAFKGNLSWLPVKPKTVKFVADGTTYTDDGTGHFKAEGKLSAGTIDYNSGAYDITLSGAASDTPVFSYDYNNMDVPVQAPEVNLKIEVAPIMAKSRKLKTIYAFDSALVNQAQVKPHELLEALVA